MSTRPVGSHFLVYMFLSSLVYSDETETLYRETDVLVLWLERRLTTSLSVRESEHSSDSLYFVWYMIVLSGCSV